MLKKMSLAVLVLVACSGQQCLDSDFDGVSDANDNCPDTPLCAVVDEKGCPGDDDGDGVVNGCDECEDTATGVAVYADGCPVVRAGVPPRCQAPDPRAVDLEYSLVSQTGETSGTILVKGVVDNYGLVDYLSDPAQQSVQLWADGVMIQELAFEDLAVDQVINLEHERSWDAGSELPPVLHYMLLVTYDPDILIDGNPSNDDCRFANNLIVRSTDDIADLLD